MDASFIFLLCFMGFMALAFKMGYKKSLIGLDQQIKSIAQIVQQAQDSLSQAQERHVHEQQYHALIQHEIDEIFKKNHHQIDEIQHQARKELAQLMENKISSSETRIDRMREEVMDELKANLTQQVIQVLESLFTHHLSNSNHENINNHFLHQLEDLFSSSQNRNEKKKKKIANSGE